MVTSLVKTVTIAAKIGPMKKPQAKLRDIDILSPEEVRQLIDLLSRRSPTGIRSRALIALCFSQLREDNDAYLVYRKLAADLPEPQPLAADLVQLASRLGMLDEVEHYRAE